MFIPYKDIIENPFRRPVQLIIPNQTKKGDKPIYMATGDFPLVNKEPSKSYTILIDMEPFDFHPNYDSFDLVITTKKLRITNPKRQIYAPVWSIILGESHKWSIPDLLKRQVQPKSKFCAYMYSNCNRDMNGVKLREEFFEQLHSKKHVDALGNCQHNTDTPSTRGASNWIDVAIDTYKPYKFVVAFENTLDIPGYVSEKIVLPLLAGAIPIYSGDAMVRDMFDPRCFINLDDFATIDHCIDFVLYVDSKPDVYETYINAPIIRKERLIEYAAWYYATQSFYNIVFNVFPHIKRNPYIPIQTSYQSDPTKNVKVINLDRSQDRWLTMQEQLDSNPHLRDKYERFPAVDGKQYYQYYKNYSSDKHFKMKPGEFGCYLSTMELSNTLVEDEHNDYYLFLEDDSLVLPEVLSLDAYVAEAPLDWEVIFLGYSEHYCTKHDKSSERFTKMDQDCMPCTHAVLVRKRAAQYLINFAFPIEVPIDVFYRNHCQNLTMYLIHPRVIRVNSKLPSTIQVAE